MEKKEQSRKKIIIFCTFAAAVCIMTGVLIYIIFRNQSTSAKRLEDQYDGTIEKFQSSTDYDGDGIDDQTDILQGALNYINTLPKYKSQYYDTGYPNDGYGVCTDVVAFAMLNAGYNLMELVQEDIALHPEDYDIDVPDANIDFRRVRNLRVYFSHTAIELTTDLSEIEEWQGGDIVIFESHVGIVSDRRNENGVPYVIHHNSPIQSAYEQDILETRDDLVAHYRISE